LTHHVLRAGYFWPTLLKDAKDMGKRCATFQFYNNQSHMPGAPMKSISSPWPFDKWGIDLVGPFVLGKGQVKILVMAVDYFTKWVEARSLAAITTARIVDCVKRQIPCRFGIPSMIVSDNGLQFCSREFQQWCSDKGIKNQYASMTHQQSNGQVEVTNRTIVDGLRKKLEGRKGNWPEFLDEVLWAYRSTPRVATNISPYELTFNMDAVSPVKTLLMSPRVMLYEEAVNAEGKKCGCGVGAGEKK
jgi:transposase InsO family protein